MHRKTLLTLADEIRPQGLTLARRGQLRVLQMVERHGSDAQTLRDEARALCGKAMEREPNNSMVLAVLSFGTVAVAQALFPLWAHHPSTAGLRVHLANGLYVNALFDRLLGGWTLPRTTSATPASVKE